jgi:hypothetical protein
MLRFIHGGYGRAVDGIRAEVEAKYAERLKRATPTECKVLRKRMKLEIRAAMKAKAPKHGLY